MPNKKPHLTKQENNEICDLYNWGARIEDIAMLYDRHPKYIAARVKELGCKARAKHRPVYANTKRNRHNVEGRIKSTRPLLPSGVAVSEGGHGEIDQLLRSSARALQAQRIEARRADANTRSCQGAAS